MRTRAAITAWPLALGLAILAAPPAEAKRISLQDLTDDPGLMPVAYDFHGNVHTADGRVFDHTQYSAIGRTPAQLADPASHEAEVSSSRALSADAPERVSQGLTLPGYSYNPPGSSLSIVEPLGPRISGNGQYIVFESRASFVLDDLNGVPDIYRQDLSTGDIQLISKTFGRTGFADNGPAPANPAFRVGAFSPAISDDGTKVAFFSGLILNDIHSDFEWTQWADTGATDPTRQAPAAGQEIGASTEVVAYWAELDANGDILDLKICDMPGDNVPGFSPGAPFIEGLDISPDGRYVVFSRSNANLNFDGGNDTAGLIGFNDRQIWLYDSQDGSVALLTRGLVTGQTGAFIGGNHNPILGGPRITGNGTWVTWPSVGNASSINLTGAAGAGAFGEVFGVNIADPDNPGPALRLSIQDGDIPSVANNSAASSPLFANGGNGINESGTFSPTEPNKMLFFSNNWQGPAGDPNAGYVTSAAGVSGLWYTSAIFLKDVSNGDLEILVTNGSAESGLSANWNGGSLGGTYITGSHLTWSGDGASYGFLADWNIPVDGFGAATGFWTPGFIAYALPYPSLDPDADVVAITPDGNPLNPSGFSGNKAALEMGPTINDAVLIVADGTTFTGDSLLFADVTVYDGTQAAGDRYDRADLGAVSAPNANDLSARGVPSADGSEVAYVSYSANIVNDDLNGFPDVFVLDRNSGTTELVSRNQTTNAVGNSGSGGHRSPSADSHEYIMTGTAGSAATQWNSISPIDMTPDGRYIVFPSNADNLGAVAVGLTQPQTQTLIDALNPRNNNTSLIYRLDRQTGEMMLVSDAHDGVNPLLPDDISFAPSISADGRYVAFQSRSALIKGFLLDPEAEGAYNVFVRDTTLPASDPAAYVLVSDIRFADGLRTDFLASIENIYPRISADGGRVVWTSRDDIMEADGADGVEEYDIYAWERDTDEISHVSNAGGNFFDGTTVVGTPNSDRFSMSRNGEYVVFNSLAPLTVDDPDSPTILFRDMYVWEAATGTTTYLNLGGDLDGFRWSFVRNWPNISDDGNLVAFWNQARFDPAKTNNQYSLYVINRATSEIQLLSKNAGGENANLDAIAFQDTGTPQFSTPMFTAPLENPEEIGIVFDLQAGNLVPDDENGHRDVFYVQVSTSDVVLIPGDTNNDGVVNVQDVTFLGNVVNNLETLPPGVSGDIDGDEDVDMDDVTTLAGQIVN